MQNGWYFTHKNVEISKFLKHLRINFGRQVHCNNLRSEAGPTLWITGHNYNSRKCMMAST